MQIRKGVTIATNSKGETRFVTKAPSGSGTNPNAASASKAPTAKAAWDPRTRGTVNVSGPEDFVPDPEPVAAVTRAVETADFGASNNAGLGNPSGTPAGTGVSDIVVQNMLRDVLDTVVGQHNPLQPNVTVNRLYRDIYLHDATCGSAIAMRSTLPFSPFTITGLRDEKLLDVFVQSVESMNMAALLPQLSTEIDVFGAFLASMAWDETKKRYTGISPHNLDLAKFEQIPAFGIDPKISITLSAEIIASLKKTEFMTRYGEFIPDDVKKFATESGSKGGNSSGSVGIELTPEHTIFIPRSGQLRDFTGMSYLRRVLPAWLYEKALIMGVHDQVYKRQRGALHISVENTEDWVADQDEMNTIASLFLSADMDPMGAVVVTRSGVTTNEVRQGGDFWRWDEAYGQIETIKLRALGISESFVTGEANYNSMEQSLSVFMEQIRDYRARITQEVFYGKMFPMIAFKNGITKRKYGRARRGEVASYGETRMGYDRHGELYAMVGSALGRHMETADGTNPLNFNPSEFVVPQIQWHKRLMPEADTEYIAMLQSMQDLGLPINIRGLAAAGGANIDDIVNGIDEDIRVREKIGQWKQRIAEIDKLSNPDGGDGMGGEDGAEEMARFMAAREMGVGSGIRRSLGSFANPDQRESEFASVDHAGRRRVLTRQGRDFIANRFARRMGEAVAEIARQENHRTRQERARYESARKFYHSGPS